MTEKKHCAVLHLGLVPYEPAWKLQARLAEEIAAGKRPPTLLLLEHPHTYTFGRRGDARHLLWDEPELACRGLTVHWVDRGGDVTYHGPGQLVGYPLIPLETSKLQAGPGGESACLPQADYVGYLRRLEAVLVAALAGFGIKARAVEGLTGVWVDRDVKARNLRVENSEMRETDDKLRPAHDVSAQAPPDPSAIAKIAAIGVKVDARGVTRHGFALNVDPDTSYWQGIVGCGLAGYTVTSLAEQLPVPPPMERVRQAVSATFGEVFGFEMLPDHLPPDAL